MADKLVTLIKLRSRIKHLNFTLHSYHVTNSQICNGWEVCTIQSLATINFHLSFGSTIVRNPVGNRFIGRIIAIYLRNNATYINIVSRSTTTQGIDICYCLSNIVRLFSWTIIGIGIAVRHSHFVCSSLLAVITITCVCSCESYSTGSYEGNSTSRWIDGCNLIFIATPCNSCTFYCCIIIGHRSREATSSSSCKDIGVGDVCCTDSNCRLSQVLRCSNLYNRTLIDTLDCLGVDGRCCCDSQSLCVVVPVLTVIAILNGCTFGSASDSSCGGEQEWICVKCYHRLLYCGSNNSGTVIRVCVWSSTFPVNGDGF